MFTLRRYAIILAIITPFTTHSLTVSAEQICQPKSLANELAPLCYTPPESGVGGYKRNISMDPADYWWQDEFLMSNGSVWVTIAVMHPQPKYISLEAYMTRKWPVLLTNYTVGAPYQHVLGVKVKASAIGPVTVRSAGITFTHGAYRQYMAAYFQVGNDWGTIYISDYRIFHTDLEPLLDKLLQGISGRNLISAR